MTLSEKEKRLICEAATQLETGRYLLWLADGEEVDHDLLAMIDVLSLLIQQGYKNSWECLVWREYLMCTDYEYAQKHQNNEP